ncbi:MAG: hypothetical protein DIU76_01515, partial [Bacillota bacterium]
MEAAPGAAPAARVSSARTGAAVPAATLVRPDPAVPAATAVRLELARASPTVPAPGGRTDH